MKHDEARQVQYPEGEETKKLGFFKDADGGKEEGKEKNMEKQWSRDEL
jgi:hypothetical protein